MSQSNEISHCIRQTVCDRVCFVLCPAEMKENLVNRFFKYFPSVLNTETKKPRISTIVRIELLKIYIISIIFIIFYFWMSLFISLSDMPFDIGMYARQFCNISVRPHSSLKYKTECYNHDSNYLS